MAIRAAVWAEHNPVWMFVASIMLWCVVAAIALYGLHNDRRQDNRRSADLAVQQALCLYQKAGKAEGDRRLAAQLAIGSALAVELRQRGNVVKAKAIEAALKTLHSRPLPPCP